MKLAIARWGMSGMLVGALALVGTRAAEARRLEEPCPEGRAAFEKTVYAKVKRDCAICHAPGGPGPTFVLPEAGAAYLRVKNYVDFVDLARSALLIRAGNNHCGKDNCNEASGREMKTLLDSWWDEGEKSCESFGRYFSEGMPVPADLPSDRSAWKRLEWDLSSISDDLSGVRFSVEAQRFSVATPDAAGSYRFRKPRVQFGFDAIRVKGLRILINGKFDKLANAFEGLDQVTAPQESKGGALLEYPVLSTQPLILLQEKGAGDSLSLAFDDIAVDARPRCKSLGRFQELVVPRIAEADCRSCHTAKGAHADVAASRQFSMDLDQRKAQDRWTDSYEGGEGAQLCSAFLQRSSLERPARSVVVELPARGKLGHPVVTPDATLYLQSIQDWLAAEAASRTSRRNGYDR